MTILVALTLTAGVVAVALNLYAASGRGHRQSSPGHTHLDAELHLLVAIAIAGGLVLIAGSLYGVR